MTRKPKYQRISLSWFYGLFKAGIFTTIFSCTVWVICWYTSVETRFTAYAAEISATQQRVEDTHDDIKDIKITVHQLLEMERHADTK